MFGRQEAADREHLTRESGSAIEAQIGHSERRLQEVPQNCENHFQGVYCRIPAHFLNRYITRIHWYIFTSDHSSSMSINAVPVEQFCIFAIVQMVNVTGFSAESPATCFVDGVSFRSCADLVVVAMHGSSSEP